MNLNTEVKKETDGSISLSIVVAWHEVEKTREQVVDELSRQVKVSGFRQGKAPKNIAQEKLSKEQVQEELLKRILTKAYGEAVEKEGIKPIAHPRIHVEAFEEGTDLKFSAETCEEPQVDLKNYKDEVKKITAKSKIIVPGKENQQNKPNLDEIIDSVIKSTDVKISKILIEQEVNRLLSQLLDELKSLGLTLDQYLSSRNKTSDQLRAEYTEKAATDLKLEFLLRKIADTEKITVEKTDIGAVLNSVKDEKQKEEMSKNPYFLAAIIRQQKTLEFLTKI